MTEFIKASEITSSFFSEMLNVKNINDFNNLIKNKSNKNIIKKGGVVLQKLILNKLRKIKKNKAKINKRISYFKSHSFIASFEKALPTRNNINISAKTSGYAPYFNNLFNIDTDRWRNKIFTSRVSNQDQCLVALDQTQVGIPTGEVVQKLQDSYRLTCYICGRPITYGNSRMECEHILPIVTALSHWWLVKFGKKKHQNIENNLISLEYDWSHKCCNRIKSNIDWVVYYDNGSSGHKKKNLWRVNTDLITHVLNQINNPAVGGKGECSQDRDTIFPKKIKVSAQTIKLQAKIQPLINIINKNMKLVGGYEKYQLFMRYKVISAISDNDFIEAIVGTLGKKIKIKSKSLKKSTSRRKKGGVVSLIDLNEEYEEYEDYIDIESDILYDLIINTNKKDEIKNENNIIIIDESIFVNYFIDYLNEYIKEYPASNLKKNMISEISDVCNYVYNESIEDISMPNDIKSMIGKLFDRNIEINNKSYDYDDYILDDNNKPKYLINWENELKEARMNVDNKKKPATSMDYEQEKTTYDEQQRQQQMMMQQETPMDKEQEETHMDEEQEEKHMDKEQEEKMPATPRRGPKTHATPIQIPTIKKTPSNFDLGQESKVQGIYGDNDGDKDGHKNVYKKGVDLDEGRRRRQETTVNTRKKKKAERMKQRRRKFLGVGGTKKRTKKRRKTRRKKTSLPKSKKKTKKVKKKRRNKTKIKKGGNKKKHKKKVKKKRNKKNKKKKQLFEMSIKELKEYVKNKK